MYEGATVTSILEQFREREAEIKAEGEKRDRAAAAQLREFEKRLKDIQSKLTAARASHAAMIADYQAVENVEAAKTSAKLRESETTITKVKDGQASLKDYLEKGLTDDQLQKKAASEAAGKLTAGLVAIRNMSRSILELERDEAGIMLSIYFCQAEPARNQILKLRAECETLDRGVDLVMKGGPLARYTKEEKESAITRANGKFIAGRTWEALDVDGLRAMRFDCEIADVFMPDLGRIITEVKPGERVNLYLMSGFQTQAEPRLDYSLVRPDGAPITTSTIRMHK